MEKEIQKIMFKQGEIVVADSDSFTGYLGILGVRNKDTLYPYRVSSYLTQGEVSGNTHITGLFSGDFIDIHKATPEQKLRYITLLEESGHTVVCGVIENKTVEP